MKKTVIASLVMLLFASSPVFAGFIIYPILDGTPDTVDFNNPVIAPIVLLPDTPDQRINVMILTDTPGNAALGTLLEVRVGNPADQNTVPPVAPWIQNLQIEGPLPPRMQQWTDTSNGQNVSPPWNPDPAPLMFFNHFQEKGPSQFVAFDAPVLKNEYPWQRRLNTGIPITEIDAFPPGGDGIDANPLFESRESFDGNDTNGLAANRPIMGILTVSTVGIGPGTWDLGFAGSVLLPTPDPGNANPALQFPGFDAQFLGTTLTIVPEPSTFVLLAMGILGLPICWWRRRKNA
ncbi:MAG TPA: PEP-CTERM sorting domain-containing protein [Thermoguttaceae bacterium]|nr:PEP-CTERM sorting domain-containing protein [Thermoguttaceae bacterium]